MHKWFRANFKALLGASLLIAALVVLRQEFKEYHYQDIIRSVEALPGRSLLLALMLTFLNYFVLTGYDTLALRYIRSPLAYPRIALASFVGYAFSNNMGMAMIAGTAVRYRLYSAWGLTTQQITQVVVFYSLTLWLGLAAIGGLAFVLKPVAPPSWLPLPFGSTQALGVLLLLLLAAYLMFATLRRKPLSIRGWEFPAPSPALSLAQILVSCLDWILAGSVLYVLLPPEGSPPYLSFLPYFLLAQIAGMVSQIPGGLGVFETILVVFLPGNLPSPSILGSLLAYRGIYYLFPLAIAALLLGTYEAVLKKDSLRGLGRAFGQWVPELAPRVLALTTFGAGVVLLLSGATPAVGGRLAWLQDFLPLPVVEVSHFLGSVIGSVLLLLSWGLQRRLDAAYFLTAAFLGGGILASLLKGLDYEEALFLAVMLASLLPCRRFFYRKASLLAEPLSWNWFAAVLVAVAGSVWLGLFAHKHVEYTGNLWWKFTFEADAPRFLRAALGSVVALVLFGFAKLMRPAPPATGTPHPSEMEKARAVVSASPATSANLALLGDKRFLFSATDASFLMYGIQGRSWVAMGDPVGKEEEMPELVWAFHELCDRHGGWAVFYEVGPRHLPLYLDLGLILLKIGEEARVPLETFTMEGSRRKEFRHIRNRLEKEGCLFEVAPAETVLTLMAEIEEVSLSWLASKNTREKRFSLGFFDPEYLKNYPMGLVRREGTILAFANLWLGAGKHEISPDLMRYRPEAPSEIMEYLFLRLILWGREQGYRWFNLGMAPLSGLEVGGRPSLAPLWNRLGAFLYRHGEHFYNFQGLRRYKEKFDPLWEPRYLAVPGGLLLPRILMDIASLISGGVKGVVSK